MVARRLYQSAAEQIAALIDSGQFAPGTRLPGERELSQRLGVSRVTIREAEIALQAIGRLEIRTGAGVYVSEAVTAARGLPEATALEILEARLVVEGEAAALAARRIDPDGLAQLEALVANIEAGAVEAEFESERQFALALGWASTNPALADTIALLWRQQDALPGSAERSCSGAKGGQVETIGEYRALIQHLRDRDPDAARHAMRQRLERRMHLLIECDERDALAATRERMQAARCRFAAR